MILRIIKAKIKKNTHIIYIYIMILQIIFNIFI